MRFPKTNRPWRLFTLAAFLAAVPNASLFADNENLVKLSTFRKYVWGAREAYERRDFQEAKKLMKRYRDLGSPTDSLLKLAGCDPVLAASLLNSALKTTMACLNHRDGSNQWMDAGEAKNVILDALRSGNTTELESYLDCAPSDTVSMPSTCGTHRYPVAADLKRLAAKLTLLADILVKSDWRSFPIKPDDPQRINWVLYTTSDHWKPCGMSGAPIMSLRQDPSGAIRIAGFAATCIDSIH